MLSVIIPYRNEVMLGFTVRRLRETISIPHEIIAVDDGSDRPFERPQGVTHIRFEQPIGAQRARHKGIEAARFDTVLVIDAHMNFTDDDWAAELARYSLENPTHVGCAITRALAPDRMDMADGRGHYYGAHIIPFEEDEREGLHYVQARRILVDKWNKTRSSGEIGCVLGGAYFMNRRYYFETLLAPWEELRGWGRLEGNISIPNFLLGGKNVCFDVEIGHMFRKKSPFASNLANLLFNELYLAHVVIADDAEREALIARLALPDDAVTRHVETLLRRSIHPWYRRYLVEKGRRHWQDYKARWMDPERSY